MSRIRIHSSSRPFAAPRAPVRVLAVALAAASLIAGAHADEGPGVKLTGFGTVAAVHSSDSNSDFIGSVFQPNGAGHTSSWSFNPDTRLGVQAVGTLNDQLSGVVQLVSQHQYDNTFTPHVEWANIKYQPTAALSLRAGRIASPSYLLSESRFVGYAMPWLRPPTEVYSVLAISSNDGLDASYRTRLGGANHVFQAYVGRSVADLTKDSKASSKPSWGFNDTMDIGSLTLRAGFNALSVDLNVPALGQLVGGLQSLAKGAGAVPVPAFQAVAAQASDLAHKYSLNNLSLTAIALGASYDPGDWFVMSEFVAFNGDGFLSNTRSWYASGGYRFGAFTPYATYSSSVASIHHEKIDSTGAAPLSAGAAALSGGINATLDAFEPTLHTTSVGLRWDAVKNVSIKAQYDRVSIGSASTGRFRTFPGLTPSKHPNLISLGADFVF